MNNEEANKIWNKIMINSYYGVNPIPTILGLEDCYPKKSLRVRYSLMRRRILSDLRSIRRRKLGLITLKNNLIMTTIWIVFGSIWIIQFVALIVLWIKIKNTDKKFRDDS